MKERAKTLAARLVETLETARSAPESTKTVQVAVKHDPWQPYQTREVYTESIAEGRDVLLGRALEIAGMIRSELEE